MKSLPIMLLWAVASGAAPAPAPMDRFECRSVGEVSGLAVLRSNGSHRLYDHRGQRPFGLEALYLNYSGSDGTDFQQHAYSSAVRASVEEVRRLVERANPDLACLANRTPLGTTYTCFFPQRPASAGWHGLRSISLYPPDGDFSVSEGTMIECRWEPPAPLLP